MATVAIDFDGVINPYSRGWADGSIYDDEPVPGAVDAINKLMETYAVFVFTSREPEQVGPWLERWFDVTIDERCGTCHGAGGDQDVDADGRPVRPAWECDACKGSGELTFWNERGQILVTNRKLPAVAYIDDRAIRFESWDQALADLSKGR